MWRSYVCIVAIALAMLVSNVRSAAAYDVYEYGPDVATESMPIVDVDEQQLHLGILEGQPHLYSFTIEATTTLTVAVWTLPKDSAPKPTLLMVKDNPIRGVESVFRASGTETEWSGKRDHDSQIEYMVGGSFSHEVTPGVYRVEVSTPENIDRYIFVVGENDTSSWWQRVRSVYTLETFAGYGWWYMVRSPLVYRPLILMSVIAGAIWYWRRRMNGSHV